MALWRIVINQQQYGQLVQNRIYMQGESFQNASEVAQHIRNGWVNHIKFLQDATVSYQSVVATSIDELPQQQHTESFAVTGGQSPETQKVSFMAGVLQFKTGLPGRQFRGRYYVAGIRMGATQFGVITANELNLWQTQINILKNLYLDPANSQSGLGLFIRGENVVHNTLVTDIAMRPILGVQRRRNIGVGG